MSRLKPYEDVPISTVESASRAGWIWAYCGRPCGRSVALPLSYFIARYGHEAPAQRILNALRCDVCGEHPVQIIVPSHSVMTGGMAALPLDRVPKVIRNALALLAPLRG